MSVVIIDYGSGNLHSAAKAFERAAREAELDLSIAVSSDPALVAKADRIVLPFDGDNAGDAAVDRVLQLFLTQEIEIAVATLPEGLDPDEFFLNYGVEAFDKLLADATDALSGISEDPEQLADIRELAASLLEDQDCRK